MLQGTWVSHIGPQLTLLLIPASMHHIAMSYQSYTAVAVAAIALVFIVSKFQEYITNQAFIRQHGCKPVFAVPQRERILGLDLFLSVLKATKERRLLEAASNRYQELGTTASMTMLGRSFIGTVDPENIKALLATNFKDFGIGQREQIFGKLIGRGIFTSDGAHWEHSRV